MAVVPVVEKITEITDEELPEILLMFWPQELLLYGKTFIDSTLKRLLPEDLRIDGCVVLLASPAAPLSGLLRPKKLMAGGLSLA